MITIVNKHKDSYDVYCGRGSALGNPFHMREESQRDVVCDKYAEWFVRKLASRHTVHHDKPLFALLAKIKELAKAGDVVLGCYCAPKRCHCETIKTYIDGVLADEDNNSRK